jgi:hypothetical protein
MRAHGGVCSGTGAAVARRLPARRPAPAARAAQGSDGPVKSAAPARKPTRKRMIDAMLREAEARKAAGLAPAPPKPAAVAQKRGGGPKAKRAPAAPAEEVLDLSAFVAGAADAEPEEQDEEGTADSFGGFDGLEDDGGEEDDPSAYSFLSAAPDAPPDGAPLGANETALNTWTFDSDVGEVVFRRVVQRQKRPSAAASAASLEALLARVEADDFADEDDEDDDGEFDPSERGVPDAALRVPTALQRVDNGDADAVIDALTGLDTAFLDKESTRLLEEELGRKLKARAAPAARRKRAGACRARARN